MYCRTLAVLSLLATLVPAQGGPSPTSTAANVTLGGAGCSGSVTLSPPVLTTSASPVLGTTITFNVGSLPSAGVLAALALDVVPILPTPISTTNMPGCFKYIPVPSLVTIVGFVAGPSVPFALAIPNNPFYLGFPFFAQAASDAPGDNNWNLLVTNSLNLIAGT